MRTLICWIFLALMCVSVYAHEAIRPWNWYFSGFNSPNSGSDVLIRSGTARVVFEARRVRIGFTEKGMPEMKATYAGYRTTKGLVKGQLNGYFLHGSEIWNGVYRQVNVDGCHFEEIVLRSGIPDGSALVLSRVRGKCQ